MKIEIQVKALIKKPESDIYIQFYEYDPDMGWVTSFTPGKILASGATKEDLEEYYYQHGVMLPDDLMLVDVTMNIEI